MMVNSPLMLIVLMALLTLLGGAMGYCIALLKVKKSVQRTVHEFRLEQDRLMFEAQQKLIADVNIFEPSDFMQPGLVADQRVISDSLLMDKSNVGATSPYNNGDRDLRVSQPPILSQREGFSGYGKYPKYSTVTRLSLDFANSRPAELDIPAIAESELPDDVDELDFRYPRLRDSGVTEGA